MEFESGFILQLENSFVDNFLAYEKDSERNSPLPQILGGILSHHKSGEMSFLAKKKSLYDQTIQNSSTFIQKINKFIIKIHISVFYYGPPFRRTKSERVILDISIVLKRLHPNNWKIRLEHFPRPKKKAESEKVDNSPKACCSLIFINYSLCTWAF